MAYNMGPVKPHVARAGNTLGHMFHIGTIGGFATSGHIPDSDHYKGLALDFMCSIPVGNQLAEYAKAHASEYNVKYIIHNRKIWSVARASEGWRPYTYGDPHTSHVHISFNAADGGNVPNGGGSGGGAQGAPAAVTGIIPTGVNIPGPFDELGSFLTSPGLWLRVAMFIGGILLFLIATGNLLKVSALTTSAVKKTKVSA